MPLKKYEYMEFVFRFDEFAKENEKRENALFVFCFAAENQSSAGICFARRALE